MAQNRNAYSQWIKRGEDTYLPSDNITVTDSIESGAYKVGYSNRDESYILNKVTIKTDNLIEVEQPEMQEVMGAVDDFYTQQKQFEKWGFVFKRGFLLYGVPGGGKTSIISNIMKYVIEKMGGVVFLVYDIDDLRLYSGFMSRVFRGIEPDRLILTVFEDIDGMHKEETLLINVLDGLGNSHNVLNIATTNYTERLSDRLINRPNRFDRRWEIKSPTYNARKQFLSARILPDSLKTINLDYWTQMTEGMTLAQLSEVIKSVFLLGEKFEDTIALLKDMKKKPDSSQYNKASDAPGLGFGLKGKTLREAFDTAAPVTAEELENFLNEAEEVLDQEIIDETLEDIDSSDEPTWGVDPATGKLRPLTHEEIIGIKRSNNER